VGAERLHRERHRTGSVAWLRASVLGANDGILSTASLLVGVAAAAASPGAVLTAGVAGLVAGAMSMAAGEYVSVSSQSDAERADLDRERAEIAADPGHEQAELAAIYVGRGLDQALAREVATQLMAKDALGSHALEELGISDVTVARPLQAAISSALSFAFGAALPLAAALTAPAGSVVPVVAATALACLILLGWFGARVGGAPAGKAIWRVTSWGAAAMAITAGIGALAGTVL